MEGSKMSDSSITAEFEIYQLTDPRDQSPKYIGISQDAQARLKQHIRNKKGPAYSWCQELAALGKEPLLIIIDYAPDEKTARLIEKRWIQQIGRRYHLLNGVHNYDALQRWEERKEHYEWLNRRFAHLGSNAKEAVRLTALAHYHIGQMEWEDTYKTVTDAFREARKLPEVNIPLSEIDILKLTLKLHGISHIDGSEVKTGNE
jgi:GIY-YIG catalytic domain